MDIIRVALPATPEEVLRAAVARAKAVPEGFNMGTWIESADTPCGTAGCLAYEICAVAGDLTERESIQSQAARLIGLEDDRPAIFFLEQWPERFSQRYKDAGSPEGRVEALEAVVESWIAGTWFETAEGGKIGGYVDLRGYNHPLPASLTQIGGYVDLRGYNHPLPASLTQIGGYVDLEGYNFSVPEPYGNKA